MLKSIFQRKQKLSIQTIFQVHEVTLMMQVIIVGTFNLSSLQSVFQTFNRLMRTVPHLNIKSIKTYSVWR